MKIRVVGYNESKELAAGLPDGILELDEGSTVRTALSRLAPAEGDLVIFLNGRSALPDTRLQEGDTLVLFAPMAGG